MAVEVVEVEGRMRGRRVWEPDAKRRMRLLRGRWSGWGGGVSGGLWGREEEGDCCGDMGGGDGESLDVRGRGRKGR